MDYLDIKNWLNKGGNFADGVKLYEAFGTDEYLKKTFFKRPESDYLKQKLKAEIESIFKKLDPIINVPVIEPLPKVIEEKRDRVGLSNEDFFNLPKELQEHRLNISKLYGEAMTARRQIRQSLQLPSKGTLTLQEAFHLMSQITNNGKGVPFRLLWLTYNEDTGEGGEVKELDCILKFGNKTASKYKNISKSNSDRRDARHDIHGTFNVQIVNTIEIRKVHSWLIFQVNGYDVVMGG